MLPDAYLPQKLAHFLLTYFPYIPKMTQGETHPEKLHYLLCLNACLTRKTYQLSLRTQFKTKANNLVTFTSNYLLSKLRKNIIVYSYMNINCLNSVVNN